MRGIEGPKGKLAAEHFPWRRYALITLAYFLFGVGYIVYLTFVIAWLKEMQLGVFQSTSIWVVLGLAVMASGRIWQHPMAHWRRPAPMLQPRFVPASAAPYPSCFAVSPPC